MMIDEDGRCIVHTSLLAEDRNLWFGCDRMMIQLTFYAFGIPTLAFAGLALGVSILSFFALVTALVFIKRANKDRPHYFTIAILNTGRQLRYLRSARPWAP